MKNYLVAVLIVISSGIQAQELDHFAASVFKELKRASYNGYPKTSYSEEDNPGVFELYVGKGLIERSEKDLLKKAIRKVKRKKALSRDQQIDLDILRDYLKKKLKIVKRRIKDSEYSVKKSIIRPQEFTWAIWSFRNSAKQVALTEHFVRQIINQSFYSKLLASLRKETRGRRKIFVPVLELDDLKAFVSDEGRSGIRWVKINIKRFLGLMPKKHPKLANVHMGNTVKIQELEELFQTFSNAIDQFKQGLKELIDNGKIQELKYPFSRRQYDAKLLSKGITIRGKKLYKLAREEFERLTKNRVKNGIIKRAEFNQIVSDFALAKGLPEETTAAQLFDNIRSNDLVQSDDELKRLTEQSVEQINKIIEDHDLITLPSASLYVHYDGLVPEENRVKNGNSVSASYPGQYLSHRKVSKDPFVAWPSLQKMLELNPDNALRGGVHNTMAHEGRPGHEHQARVLRELPNRSLIRQKYFRTRTSTEGWALYAENIIAPYLSKNDLENRLYYKLWYLIRVVRVITDYELAMGKINRDQAMAYYTEALGQSKESAHAEIERRFKRPGNDSSYFFGLWEILNLKEDIKKDSSLNFTEKCFNDLVVRAGYLPAAFIKKIITSGNNCLTDPTSN